MSRLVRIDSDVFGACEDAVVRALKGEVGINEWVSPIEGMPAMTPLMIAVQFRQWDAQRRRHLQTGVSLSNDHVRGLIDAGADVNSRTEIEGVSVLALAGKYGDRETVDLLVKAGADVSACDANGTPVFEGVLEVGDPAKMKILIDAGVPLNTRRPFFITPFGRSIGSFNAAESQIVGRHPHASWKMLGTPTEERFVGTFQLYFRAGGRLNDMVLRILSTMTKTVNPGAPAKDRLLHALATALVGTSPQPPFDPLPKKTIARRQEGARLQEVRGTTLLSEEEMNQRLNELQGRKTNGRWIPTAEKFAEVFYGPPIRGVAAMSDEQLRAECEALGILQSGA
eukprot:Cvel_10102.t1-p1 / transcript=Cvel_10102.t1 / gene=Cvel_10102 / organism=Chromera_velia_CCMP2878 / gene_product=hypothetical protein / transcript_product=hypothetical protein / location=Cvel_scaffold602:8504-9520(+) / protein_length=339 / sequence_SO=supercontig / SO=protein_coding / is_pseudo=false